MPIADELAQLRRTLATASDLSIFWHELLMLDGFAEMLGRAAPWTDVDARLQIARQAAAAAGTDRPDLAKVYYSWWPEYGMAHGTVRFESPEAVAVDFVYFLDLEMGSFSIGGDNRPDTFTRFVLVPADRKGRVA